MLDNIIEFPKYHFSFSESRFKRFKGKAKYHNFYVPTKAEFAEYCKLQYEYLNLEQDETIVVPPSTNFILFDKNKCKMYLTTRSLLVFEKDSILSISMCQCCSKTEITFVMSGLNSTVQFNSNVLDIKKKSDVEMIGNTHEVN
jgi:hypothetical protein